jgi:hypothetical protein
MKPIRIFVSSPGDVELERQIARRVIARMQAEFGQKPAIDPYFWEYEPMRLTKDFQGQIPPTSSFDIVVCILWSRLGTPLAPQHHRPDGTPYQSGTEFELEDAVEGHGKNHGIPDILVYRNMTDPPIKPRPREVRALQLAQIDALDAFLDRWTKDGDIIKGALTKYNDVAQFEELLAEHLRKLIELKRPDDQRAALARRPSNWTAGSPFRGLEPFEFEHAPVFRGRTRAVQDVIGLLRDQYVARQAWTSEDVGGRSSPVFVLVSAMSGIGKSSLIRAGVLPLLTAPGVIEGIGLWRRALMKPTGKTNGLMAALSEALTAPGALPELLSDGTTAEGLAQALHANPASIDLLIKGGLSQAAAGLQLEEETQLRQWEADFAAKGRAADAERSRMQRELLLQRGAALALFVDQFEEIFTAGDKNAEVDRDAFLVAIDALARSGRVTVLATLRSDFFARAGQAPVLAALTKEGALYQLEPPTITEWAQIIREPAREAGLTFEEDTETGSRLDDILLAATQDDPAVLPLLEFTLDKLYQGRDEDGRLTHATYRNLNGVEGALALTAEQEYAALGDRAKSAFGRVFGALVNLADVHQEERPVRRRAATAELALDPGAGEFINRFAHARLFVLDQDAAGHQGVSVVHEALFSHWGRLKRWIDDNRELLRVRGRVEDAARLWDRGKRPRDLLLVGGRALIEAQDLVGRSPEIALGPTLSAFVAQSSAVFRARQRWRRIVAVAVVAVLSVAGVASFYERKARLQTQIDTKLAEYQQALRDAESVYIYRTANADSLRAALDKSLRVYAVRDEVTGLRGRPPDTAEADTMLVLEMTGFLRAELDDVDASLHDFQARDEMAKRLQGAKFSAGAGASFGMGAYARVVLDMQMELVIANDQLRLLLQQNCASRPKDSQQAEQCLATPEDYAREDIERNKRHVRMMDYMTRVHPYERDFGFLSYLLQRDARNYEILKQWDEARRAWEQRQTVAQRKVTWEQERPRNPVEFGNGVTIPNLDTMAQLTNRTAKPLLEVYRDLADFHLRRNDQAAALKAAKSALEIMTIVKDGGGTLTDAEIFATRKVLALALAGTGAIEEARATLEPGADALTKSSFNTFVGDWDKLERVFRDVAQTRMKLTDDAGTLKIYADLVWLLESETMVLRRGGLVERLASTYVSLSWYQIFARQFDAAIAITRKGIALKDADGKLGLKLNLAHALLLKGEVNDAITLYEESKNEVFSQPQSGPPRLFAHVVLEDFDEFAKRDLTRHEMAAIRASMQAVVDQASREPAAPAADISTTPAR